MNGCSNCGSGGCSCSGGNVYNIGVSAPVEPYVPPQEIFGQGDTNPTDGPITVQDTDDNDVVVAAGGTFPANMVGCVLVDEVTGVAHYKSGASDGGMCLDTVDDDGNFYIAEIGDDGSITYLPVGDSPPAPVGTPKVFCGTSVAQSDGFTSIADNEDGTATISQIGGDGALLSQCPVSTEHIDEECVAGSQVVTTTNLKTLTVTRRAFTPIQRCMRITVPFNTASGVGNNGFIGFVGRQDIIIPTPDCYAGIIQVTKAGGGVSWSGLTGGGSDDGIPTGVNVTWQVLDNGVWVNMAGGQDSFVAPLTFEGTDQDWGGDTACITALPTSTPTGVRMAIATQSVGDPRPWRQARADIDFTWTEMFCCDL